MAAWLKRGLWGIELRKQTLGIAIVYITLSLLALAAGFVFIESPERFLNQSQKRDLNLDVKGTTNSTSDEDFSSSEKTSYDLLIRHIQNEGVEIVIGSLLTLTFSILLVVGVRLQKSVWFMPWLVQQSFECLISVGLFFIQLVSGHKFSFLQVISFLAYLMISSYFIYSVLSHYILLRRMDKNSAQVISSVMEDGGYTSSGVNYQRLQEEVGKDLNLSTLTLPTTMSNPTASVPAATRQTTATTNNRRDDIMYFSID